MLAIAILLWQTFALLDPPIHFALVLFHKTTSFPECMDKRCKDTNAMKTSAMLNNQCDGVKVTFLMYITI